MIVPWLRRWVRRLLLGGLVLAVLLALLWVFRVPLLGPLLEGQLETALSDALGGRYEVEIEGGSFLGGVELGALRTLEPPPTGAIAGVAFERASASYDLLGLLRGRGLEAVHRVTVEGLDLALDTDRPSGPSQASGEARAVPSIDWPALDLRGDVSIRTPEGEVALDDLHIDATRDGALELAIDDVSAPSPFDLEGAFAGRIERGPDGEYVWTSDSRLGGLRIPDLRLSRTGSLGGTVALEGGTIDFDLSESRLDIHADAIDLATIPSWLPALLDLPVPLPTEGLLSGRVESAEGDLALRFDVQGRDIVWRGERLDEVVAQGATLRHGDEIRVERLRARGPKARVAVDDGLLDPDLPFVVREVADLEVEIESLAAFFPDLERDVQIVAEATGTGGESLRLQRLVITSGEDELRFQGRATLPARPEDWPRTEVTLDVVGEVGSLAPLALPMEGRLAIEGGLEGTLEDLALELGFEGRALEVEGVALDGGRLAGDLRWPEARLAELVLQGPAGRVEARGPVSLDPLGTPGLEVVAEVGEAGRLAALLGEDAPALEGRLRLEGRVSRPLPAPGRPASDAGWRASATLTADGLVVDGEAVGAVEAELAWDGERLDVPRLALAGDAAQVRLAGWLDPGETRAHVESLVVDLEERRIVLAAPIDLDYGAEEVQLDGLALVSGDLRAEMRATLALGRSQAVVHTLRIESPDAAGRLRAPLRLDWAGEDLGVPRLEATVTLDDAFDVVATDVAVDPAAERLVLGGLQVAGPFGTARLLAPLALERRGEAIALEGLRGRFEDVEVAADATVAPSGEGWRASVRALRVEQDGRVATLRQTAVVHLGEDLLLVEGLDARLAGEGLGATARGWARLAPEREVALTLSDWDLGSRLPEELALGAGAEVELRLVGEGLLVAARVPSISWDGWEVALDLDVRQAREGPITLARLDASEAAGGRLRGRGRLPWRLDLEELALEHLDDVEGRLALRGRLEPSEALGGLLHGPVTLALDAEGSGLVLEVEASSVGHPELEDVRDAVRLVARLTPEAGTVEIGIEGREVADLDGRVRVVPGFDWTRPPTLADFAEEATVSGGARFLLRSWEPVGRLAEGIEGLEGAAAANLRIEGTLAAPEITGLATLQNARLDLGGDLAPFHALDASIGFDGERLAVDRLEGLMGHAPFQIRGTVDLPRGGFPVLDLQVEGRNTQLIRSDYVRLRVDLDARVRGPLDALEATGRGRITDLLFREPMELSGAGVDESSPEFKLFAIRDWPFSDMAFDLEVDADESLRIRNNLLRVDASADVRLRGTGFTPEPVGRIDFEGGDVFLPLTTLRDLSGEVVFPLGEASRPRIRATARTRLKGYEVGAQLVGRLPDLDVYAYSEPYLPPDEATLLLATGSTRAELAEGGILGTALAGVADTFGGSVFASDPGLGEPGDKTFFQRFQFTSELDGTRIDSFDVEFEMTERFYLHVEQDEREERNVGLIWRLRLP